MKFSESLLKDKELGGRVFESSIKKSEKLLSDIFGIDFERGVEEKNIISYKKDKDSYLYEVVFKFKEREIKADLTFEPENDIFSEVLKIFEYSEEIIEIQGNSFNEKVKNIISILEEKYGLDFVPLDPEQVDKNIKKISSDEEFSNWETKFTADHHESTFNAKLENDKLTIKEDKEHLFYLD